MQKTHRESVLIIAGALLMPLLWTVGTTAALAGTPRAAASTVTRTGPKGNAATRQSNLSTNGQGGYNASSTVTGANGRTATRQSAGAYNAATQTASHSSTTTGPRGNSATESRTVTATPQQ